MRSPPLRCLAGLTILLVSLSAAAWAQGTGGDPRDRLDAQGSPTDRYLVPEEVRDVLHTATDGFFLCFRRHLPSAASAADAAVTFAIDGSGKAGEVTVESGQDLPTPLRGCLAEVVVGLTFDDHDGDPFEVSYPVVYVVDAKGARVLPYPVVFIRPRAIRMPLLQTPVDLLPGELLMLERVFTAAAEAVDDKPEPPDPSTGSPAEPPAPTPDPAP